MMNYVNEHLLKSETHFYLIIKAFFHEDEADEALGNLCPSYFVIQH